LKKEQNTIEIQPLDTASPGQLAVGVHPHPASQNTGEPGFKSVGWRVHNELTYRGVDFLLNSTIGVALTYWSQRTHTGQTYFAKPVANFFKGFMKLFSKNPATLETGATAGSMFTSIILGGTAIIPPMIALENQKLKHAMVCSIDEMVYGKEAVENDPKFAELHDSITHEPKKNFATGMAARFAVLVPMLAATITPKANAFLEKHFYNHIANGTKFAARKMGIAPKNMMNTVVDGKSNWDFLHHTIGFDFGLTFVYSFLHEYAFKAFAMLERKDEPAAAPEAQHAPLEMLDEKPATSHAAAVARPVSAAGNYREYVSSQPQPSMAMGAI